MPLGLPLGSLFLAPGLLLGLAVALAVGLVIARPAAAACGGVQSARPPERPRTYLAPLELGDSTSIFALPSLAAEGFDANARGCRQFPEAIAVLGRLRHAHALPHLVVLALGANGPVTGADVRRALAILGRSRQLVLVTSLQAGGRPGPDAGLVRAEARRHPDHVHVLDWVAYSAGHAAWFQPDRLHLTFPGAAAFARLLGHALPLAPPPSPTPIPAACPTRPPPAKPVSPVSPVSPATPAPPRPLGRLDPANPLVTLASASPGGSGGGGGVLAADAQSRTTAVELENHNPFAVAGTVGLTAAPSAPGALGPGPGSARAPAPAPAIAASPLTCVALPPGAPRIIRIGLGTALGELLGRKQRLAVRVTVDLFDQSGTHGTVRGTYLLTRPPRTRGSALG